MNWNVLGWKLTEPFLCREVAMEIGVSEQFKKRENSLWTWDVSLNSVVDSIILRVIGNRSIVPENFLPKMVLFPLTEDLLKSAVANCFLNPSSQRPTSWKRPCQRMLKKPPWGTEDVYCSGKNVTYELGLRERLGMGHEYQRIWQVQSNVLMINYKLAEALLSN